MKTLRQFIAESKSFEGKFAHHPTYVYHGTTEKRARSILRSGKFAKKTYLATHPAMAKLEGDAKVHGDAAMGAPLRNNLKKAEGGKTVVLKVRKDSLNSKHFRKDRMYGKGDNFYGHAFYSKRAVSAHGASRISARTLAAHARKLRGTEPQDG